jgi:hypothetical protein
LRARLNARVASTRESLQPEERGGERNSPRYASPQNSGDIREGKDGVNEVSSRTDGWISC